MEITIKIKLDSGKEIELSENEYTELKNKIGHVSERHLFVPHIPNPWPSLPFDPYQPLIVTCSDNTELPNG